MLTDLIAGLQVAIDDYEPVMHGSAHAYLIGLRHRADDYLRYITHSDTPTTQPLDTQH